MTILETLKKWSDVELGFTNKDIILLKEHYRHIILYYFFGSCDLCAQAMDLDDANFKNLYRDILTYIGISNVEIDAVFEVWMLDKFSDKELFIIKHGARCFREFENNPKGVGGLRFCFTKFSNNSKQSND
tara:strand:- start:12 stop:401 length:390 start_codon:yes stop_codon:yes gene_type:complete